MGQRTDAILLQAAEQGRLWLARMAIASGADVNCHDHLSRTPLHLAALVNAAEIAKLLLDRGASVDARDVRGETPLHYAATNMDHGLDVATLLLAHGADATLEDVSGWTPMRRAIADLNAPFVELLERPLRPRLPLPGLPPDSPGPRPPFGR